MKIILDKLVRQTDGERVWYSRDDNDKVEYPTKALAISAFNSIPSDPNIRYRIVEYHNDEPDSTRKRCSILWKSW